MFRVIGGEGAKRSGVVFTVRVHSVVDLRVISRGLRKDVEHDNNEEDNQSPYEKPEETQAKRNSYKRSQRCGAIA